MTLTTRGSRLFSVDPFEMVSREFAPVYGVDVREDADKLYVQAEMPGFRKDEIEIVLDESVLTIAAKHAEVPADSGINTGEPAKWLLRERHAREYKRAFRLPTSANGASVDAVLQDGVLHVTLTKREETKPRKIAVN